MPCFDVSVAASHFADLAWSRKPELFAGVIGGRKKI